MAFRLAKESKRTAFATRASAGQTRARLVAELLELPPGATFEIDLAGVEAMTVSFADELIAKLAAERRLQGTSDTFFVISNTTPEIFETIEVALERRNLFVVHRSHDNKYTLAGAPEHLVETFRVAVELQEFTARDLADAMGLQLPAANNRIKQMAEAGVVIRKLQAPARGGREYLYRAAA